MPTWVLIILTIIHGHSQTIYQGPFATEDACWKKVKQLQHDHVYTFPYTGYSCKNQTTDNRIKE
jgi:hypothetical protein